jgi:hypothetical protein
MKHRRVLATDSDWSDGAAEAEPGHLGIDSRRRDRLGVDVLHVARGGEQQRRRAYPRINTVAGQTIFFLGLFAGLCGVFVMLSLGKGKYVWATLGLLAAGVAAAAALWGLVDADGFAARFADVEAFDEGTLSARAAIGLFIGLGGGVLAVLGALLSYRFTPPVAE